MKNHKNIIDKLLNSFTYFLCQNIAEVLNQSENAKDVILSVLGSKDFYQDNLNIKDFLIGNINFKILHSGKGQVKIIQGKGSMNSVQSEQGRLSYMIQ